LVQSANTWRVRIPDRRREPRVTRSSLLGWIKEDGLLQICPVLDIGRHGLQLHWATTASVGTVFPIRLVHQETGRVVDVTATLVWSHMGAPSRSGFRVDDPTPDWQSLVEICRDRNRSASGDLT
jgi:hypothetical protein